MQAMVPSNLNTSCVILELNCASICQICLWRLIGKKPRERKRDSTRIIKGSNYASFNELFYFIFPK